MNYVAAAYGSVVAVLLACAAYALLLSRIEDRRRRARGLEGTAEDFITARNSAGVWLLAFSLFATAMGSWATSAPANYASTAGLLGLVAYSLSSGAPLVGIAYFGAMVKQADPDACSLPDFLIRRYSRSQTDSSGVQICSRRQLRGGLLLATIASAMMLLNMSVALLAEYATLASLFREYVGVEGFVGVLPVALMALLTMSYTSAGGLKVSIYTDRLQASSALLLTAVLAVWMVKSCPHYSELGPLTRDQMGFSSAGFSSLFTMPASLLTSTLCSEAIWQRVWASESDRALRRASWLAFAAVSTVVFFFGFTGFMALWMGRASIETTNPNLYFFAFFSSRSDAKLDSVQGLLALVCAALMSEGAADSLQNGITATLSSTLLQNRPLWATQLLVFFVNVPLAVIGASPLVNSVLQLFLMANLASVAVFLPLLLSMARTGVVREHMSEAAAVLGCLCGFVGLTVYGYLRVGTLSGGARMAWLDNGYAWDYFAAAIVSSALGLLLGLPFSPTSGQLCGNRGKRCFWHRAQDPHQAGEQEVCQKYGALES